MFSRAVHCDEKVIDWLIVDKKWVITVHAASLSLQIWLGQQPKRFSAEKQLIIERALSEDVIDLQRALL